MHLPLREYERASENRTCWRSALGRVRAVCGLEASAPLIFGDAVHDHRDMQTASEPGDAGWVDTYASQRLPLDGDSDGGEGNDVQQIEHLVFLHIVG